MADLFSRPDENGLYWKFIKECEFWKAILFAVKLTKSIDARFLKLVSEYTANILINVVFIICNPLDDTIFNFIIQHTFLY